MRRVALIFLALTLIIGVANAYNVTVYAKDAQNGNTVNDFFSQLDDLLKTTNSGSLIFENVTEGEHTLMVWADSYATSKYVINVSSDVTVTAYLNRLIGGQIVEFRVLRGLTPVEGVVVKVYLNGNLTNSQYTGDDGVVAFFLTKDKQYRVDVNNSEKVVNITPSISSYTIFLPLYTNFTEGNNTHNITTGTGWTLINISGNASKELNPTSKAIITSTAAWVAMVGSSIMGINPTFVGLIVLVVMAKFGYTKWVVVLLCGLVAVSYHILRGGEG